MKTANQGKMVRRLAALLTLFAAGTALAGSPASRVSPEGNSGASWTVRLDATDNWSQPADASGRHHLETTLEPVGKGESASDSSPYSIDVAKESGDERRSSTTITSVFPPDHLLRRDDPRVVLVIDDGPDGSGFQATAGGRAPIQNLVTPTGVSYRSRWVLKQRGDREIAELTIWFDPQRLELAGTRDYQAEVLVRDRLEHEVNGKFQYHYQTAQQPAPVSILPGDASALSCRYRLAVTPAIEDTGSTKAWLGEGALIPGITVAGLRLELPTLPEGLVPTVLDKLRVTTDGPIRADALPAGGDSVPYRITGLSGAKRSWVSATVRFQFPDHLMVDYRIPRHNGQPHACPDNVVDWSITRQIITGIDGKPRSVPSLVQRQSALPAGTTVERVIPGDSQGALAYTYQVVRGAATPAGKFVYDASRRQLRYEVASSDGTPLSLTGSSAKLSARRAAIRHAGLSLTDGAYQYRFANVLEGWHAIDAQVALHGFHVDPASHVASSTLTLKGETLAKGSPPVISRLDYDYGRQALLVQVRDEGTPSGRLDVHLFVGGAAIPLLLDDKGRAEIPLPQQRTKFPVRIAATDLAFQTTLRESTIFGLDLYSGTQGPLVISEHHHSDAHVPFGAEALGKIKDGKIAYREICPKTTCPPGAGQGVGGKPQTPRPGQKRGQMSSGGASRSTTTGTGGISGLISEEYQGYLRKKYQALPKRARDDMILREAVAIMMGGTGSKRPGHRPPTPSAGVPLPQCTVQYINCGPVKYTDMTPPEIHDLAIAPGQDGFTARISDPSTPLDQLIIDYHVSASSGDITRYSRRHFDSRTGKLSVSFPADPLRESTYVTLSARDPDRNSANADQRLVTAKPPEIQVRTWPAPDAQHSVGLFADVWDASGIDKDLTRLSLDGVPCAAVYLHGGFSKGERGFGERGAWYCRIEATEGSHRFSASATDMYGATASASTGFGQVYPPVISDFRLLAKDPAASGITVLGARITDAGGDLARSGLSLGIDGAGVDDFYFDPVTGSFGLDGPLTLKPGFHQAILSATDRGGHSASARLDFAFAGSELSASVAGNLLLNPITVFELANGNGDGLANPGELIRLFFTLTNNGKADLHDLELRVTIDDPGVRLEHDRFTVSALPAGGSASNTDHIDLRIDADLLSREGLELKALPVLLDVTDARGRQWRLQGSLTVYQQRAVFSAGHVGPLPGIAILNPSAGQRFDFGALNPAVGQVTVQGRFTTGDAPLQSLALEAKNASGAVFFEGTPTIVAPGLFQITVPVGTADAGSVQLAARITTTDGDSVDNSITVQVAVQAAVNAPPAIAITTPLPGQNFSTGGGPTATVTVLGTFDNADSPLTNIAVAIGGSAVMNATAGIIGPGLWQAAFTLPPGNYTVSATIHTQDGDQATTSGPGPHGGLPITFSVLPF